MADARDVLVTSEERRQLDELLLFQNTLVEAAEMPSTLEPQLVLPWFVRLIVDAKKARQIPSDYAQVCEDMQAFEEVLGEISKSVWSPDEAALAGAALDAAADRKKQNRREKDVG